MSSNALAGYSSDIANFITQHPDNHQLQVLAARAGELGPVMAEPLLMVLKITQGPDNLRLGAQGMCKIGPAGAAYAAQIEAMAREHANALRYNPYRGHQQALYMLVAVLNRMGKGGDIKDLNKTVESLSYEGPFIQNRQGIFDPSLCDMSLAH